MLDMRHIFMITLGIDIGSITTKAALVIDNKLHTTRVGPTGYDVASAWRAVVNELLAEVGLELPAVSRIVSTGLGRESVDVAHRAITEITCHAAGVHYCAPAMRSVIDIGGQDSKAIALEDDGRVRDFAMNDRCAAGTGRFMEVMARAMQVHLTDLGALSLQASAPAHISSLCTVFAESEVISLLAQGESRENIIAGIHESIATRVAALAHRAGVSSPLMMTGGVARNVGVVRALESHLHVEIVVSPLAQVMGAIGAAVLAAGA